MPARTPDAVPAKPAAPVAQPTAPATAGAAAAAAAAPRRSWMGPIAGLAAGLGIAALMSHLGLGAEFGNLIMMVLLAVAAFALIRFLMRRFMPSNPAAANGGMQLAGAGAPVAKAPLSFPDERPAQYRGLQPGADAAREGTGGIATPAASPPPLAAASLPAGFDVAAFERIAKMIFIRLQAANDAGDLKDLRAFTTPEMFAAVRLDLQERGPTAQRTDVVRVDAEVLDVASEADRQVVSVRFHGLIREQIDGVAEPFDEVWHLVKPTDGSREWAIAGIQQSNSALAQAA
jgi:predicted lipid-binding transport protein (Tim44 family)